MTRTKPTKPAFFLIPMALLACALVLISGCNFFGGGGGTADSNAGIAWQLVRTGGGLESPAGTTGEPLLSVAWGDGRFVAVGRESTILHSDDGTSWTAASQNPDLWVFVVASGDSRFIGIAWDAPRGVNIIAHSTDGDIWERGPEIELDGDARWLRDIAWDGRRFVAVGDMGSIMHSADGESWTNASTTATEERLFGVVWNGSHFVAVGNNGTTVHSADGDRWTEASATGTEEWLQAVTWGDGRFVAVGRGGTIIHSADGATWKAASVTATGADLFGVAYGDGRFVAVGDGIILHSADANQWTASSDTAITNWFFEVAHGATHFIAIALNNDPPSSKIVRSTDGTTWNEATDTDIPGYIGDVAYGANRFVAVGDNGTIVTSP